MALRQTLEQQVFGDRHVRQHAQFLMHDPNAGAIGVGRRARTIRLAVERDLSVVGRIEPAEQVDERRFACAVLAEQDVSFAARDLERNAAQGDDAWKALADCFQRKDWIVHRSPCRRPTDETFKKGRGLSPAPSAFAVEWEDFT